MIGFRALLAAAGRGLSQAVVAVTWNPEDKHSTVILSNGNLDASRTDSTPSWATARSTVGKTTGKSYAEFVDISSAQKNVQLGIAAGNVLLDQFLGLSGAGGNCVSYYHSDGKRHSYLDGVQQSSSSGTTWGIGDVIGIALDLDSNTVEFFKNNVLIHTKDISAAAGTTWYAACNLNSFPVVTARFKAADFTYAPPTGFSPWES